MRKWLAKQRPAATIADLQALLDIYRQHYNERRRKTHLDGMTPAQRYALGPLDGPGTRPHPWPVLITSATVSASGCVGLDNHQLGVGRHHAGQAVTMIRQHRQITVFASDQLIAEFTLTGNYRYQAKNRTRP